MKKSFLFLLSTVLCCFTSCDSETSVSQLESQTTKSKVNQVYFTGKVNVESSRSNSPKVSTRMSGCGVTGPECASSNQILTYTYSGANNVRWTVNSGSISINSGQGTNTVSLSFGSNFTGGTVTATNSQNPSCTVILDILNCGAVPPSSCGIDVNDVYELNSLGGENVVFYTVPNVTSGWSITSSLFTVTYQDGSSSIHDGQNNYYGYQQIIIPVSCSNKVSKVEAKVFGISNSNVTCSDVATRDWGTIGVCGTAGDFN